MIADRRRRLPAMGLLIASGAVAAAVVTDARHSASADWRQVAPWCAYQGGFDGGFDCGYYTFEQCMATARGLGGYCSPNPRATHDPYRQPRRSRRQLR